MGNKSVLTNQMLAALLMVLNTINDRITAYEEKVESSKNLLDKLQYQSKMAELMEVNTIIINMIQDDHPELRVDDTQN